MVIPLDALISMSEAKFEKAVAAMRRAKLLGKAGADDVTKKIDRVAQTSLREIIANEIKYDYLESKEPE